MATTTVDILVRARDEASKTLQGVGNTAKSVGTRFSEVGAAMSSAGSRLTRSVTLPIVAFGAVAVKEFGEAAKVGAQTEAVIKSTGGAANVTASHVGSLSEKLGNLAVVDDEVVQQGANMLLTFKNIRNETGKGNAIFDRSTKALLDMSTAMGTEPKQAAIQLGKALNDPIKGISALSRVGIQFSEKQKAQISAMVESGNILGAQKIILAELETQFGGSAAAAGKAATPFERLRVVGANLAESIGGILVPMLEGAGRFVERLAAAFQSASPAVQRAIVVAGGLAAVLGPVLIVLGKVVTAIGTIIKIFGVLSKVLALNPWALLIIATIAIVVIIIKNWDKIKAFLLRVWEAIKSAGAAVWNAIKAAAIAVWNALKAPVLAYFNFYRGIFRTVVSVARTAWNTVKSIATGAWNGIKTVWNGVKSFFSGIWNGVKDLAIGAFNAIRSWWNSTVGGFGFDVPSWVPGVGGRSFRIPFMAEGGLVTGPMIAMLGERGPELVLPLDRVLNGTRAATPVNVMLGRDRFWRELDYAVTYGGRQ